ncbi:MAG: Na+/H+ antiporter NhaC family protein [Clostridium sp.]
MRKIKGILTGLLFVLGLMVLLQSPVFAAEKEGVEEALGVFTLIPPIAAIVLAFITKNVVISLFVGVLSGCFLYSIIDNNVFLAIINSFLDISQRALNALADPWNAGIVLQVLVIGGVIALVGRMGGAKAVAISLSKRAKSPRSSQLITWLLGIFVFFDDYANSLIVGPVMRPVSDKMKISREKFSFILDATAAPIAGIAIVSTWVGYELSVIKDSFMAIDPTGNFNAMNIFIETIPYRFYNILMLIFVALTAVLMREFGPMYKAEIRARREGKLLRDGATPLVSEDSNEFVPEDDSKNSIWNAVIPIGTLIIGAFVGFYYSGYNIVMGSEDAAAIEILKNSPFSLEGIYTAFGNGDASVVLFQAALLASIVAIFMGISKKIFTFTEAIETWVCGMKSLIMTGVILILAWSLAGVIKDIGTANYLVQILSGHIPAFILPSLIFILGAIMSFSTGTAYGTMGIIMPLAIPLGFSINPSMDFVVLCTSAVLTGAIFGDHCSPISDTTIMSSMGGACDHIDHTKTQIVYALVVAAITVVFGYIPAGLGVSVYLCLPMAILAIFVTVRFFGKKVDIA